MLGLLGCGGGERIVVRIGAAAITEAEVHERISETDTDPHSRKQALESLIASEWLIGEAAARGLAVANVDVRGSGRLRAASGLAATKLRELSTRNAGSVADQQLASYYARHRQRFSTPERRVVRLSNRKTRDAAERLRRQVEAGGSLTSAAQRKVGAGLVTFQSAAGGRNPLEAMVYAAQLHVLSGPVRVGIDYDVFEVERIVPATYKTLGQVRGLVRSQVIGERERRALATFIEAWRARWTSRTDCSRGYVVQRCRQYAGPRRPEDPTSFD